MPNIRIVEGIKSDLNQLIHYHFKNNNKQINRIRYISSYKMNCQNYSLKALTKILT
jgi:hypothetical protein